MMKVFLALAMALVLCGSSAAEEIELWKSEKKNIMSWSSTKESFKIDSTDGLEMTVLKPGSKIFIGYYYFGGLEKGKYRVECKITLNQKLTTAVTVIRNTAPFNRYAWKKVSFEPGVPVSVELPFTLKSEVKAVLRFCSMNFPSAPENLTVRITDARLIRIQ